LTKADQVQQLVLLRTGPGQAQILGVAIDGARLPDVVGTLAGDDTILVITRGARQARALVKRIDAIASGH
jgi:transcriptional regulator of arginine metabolism